MKGEQYKEEKSGKRGGGTQALLKDCVPWG